MNAKIAFKYLLILSIVFYCKAIFCQKGANNSTKNLEVKNVVVDSNLANKIYLEGWTYLSTNPDKALIYADSSIALAEQLGVYPLTYKGLNLKGLAYWAKGDNNKALEILYNALDTVKKYNLTRGEFSTKNNIGIVLVKKNDFYQAYLLHKEIYDKAIIDNNTYKIQISYFNMGSDLQMNGDYNKALQIFLDLEKKNKKSKAKEKNVNALYVSNAIATNYLRTNNIDEGWKYLKESLNNPYLDSSKIQELELINLYGHYEIKNKNYPKAINYFKDLKKEATNGNWNAELIKANAGLCEAYHKSGKYNLAITSGENCINAISEKGKKLQEREVFKYLSLAFAKVGKHKKAYIYSQEYNKYVSQYQRIVNNNKLKEVHSKYDLKNTNNEMKLLRAQNELEEAEIKKDRIESLAISFLFLVILGVTLYLKIGNRKKQKETTSLENQVFERTKEYEQINQHLQEKNTELQQFAYIASHDLKEPLRNISSFAQLIERKSKGQLDEETREYLTYLNTNVAQMQQLIMDVLQYSKVSELSLDLKEVNVNKLMQVIKNDIASKIEETNASVLTSDLPTQMVTSSEYFKIVLKALIINGITYNTSSTPTVKIKYSYLNNNHIFRISDNGIGIDNAYYHQIFQMFKRLHGRDEFKGSGIGLALSKKVCELLKGEIKLISEVDAGSTFILTLPDLSKTSTTANTNSKALSV